MITTHIMISMLLILAAVLVPVIYFKKSKHISLVVFFLGGVGFYLSSQVLEKILHRIVLQPKADGSIALQMENPWLYVLYGVAVAAIFEETARGIVFYLLQKKRPMTVSDGLAYCESLKLLDYSSSSDSGKCAVSDDSSSSND